MNLEDYRTVFASVSLVLILVAAFPGLNVAISFPRSVERFSELWILGPERMAEGYPFNVTAGEGQGPVHIGVRNHMGASQYYLVHAKFRNQTQPLPDVLASEASPLPPLYEFRFFLADEETWETSMSFVVKDVVFKWNSSFVGLISINDHVFPINLSSRWNSDQNGFYYELFLELWLYDQMLQSFRFHERFVGIWLNMTN